MLFIQKYSLLIRLLISIGILTLLLLTAPYLNAEENPVALKKATTVLTINIDHVDPWESVVMMKTQP